MRPSTTAALIAAAVVAGCYYARYAAKKRPNPIHAKMMASLNEGMRAHRGGGRAFSMRRGPRAWRGGSPYDVFPAPVVADDPLLYPGPLYVSDDVDPIITGNLYAYRGNTRDVYTGRAAVGGQWGLQEFAPDSVPGAVGVDVGPNALAEYAGSEHGYDDGIPEEWGFPSTPIRWYRPSDASKMRGEDYHGPQGPAVGRPDLLYDLWLPDHDPQIGEE